MFYIVGIMMAGLAIGTFLPYEFYQYLYLDFDMILKGQVWRLFTFIIPIEPLGSFMNILFFALMTYFYYIIGNALERAWGAFRFNLYIFSGIFFNFFAALISYLITGISLFSPSIDNVSGTLFFAFAAIYPDTVFYFSFLIPLKAKYIAWIRAAFYIYDIYVFILMKQYLLILPIVVSFANFLIFFFATRNYSRMSPTEYRRKATFRRQMNEGRKQGNVTQFRGHNVITRHKCAVCGKTELDNDQLEFRFCSKCDGNYEYCMEHLFTHEHVHKE